MTIELDGKTVLITGGTKGIGLTAARICLDAGASVVVCGRGKDALAAALAELEGRAPGRTAGTTADVAVRDDVDRVLALTIEKFGRVDGLIHSAAIYGPIGTILQVDPDEWWNAMRVNLLGTMLVVQLVGKAMAQTGGGRMALFSGGGAASPFPNFTAYGCSKAALVRLTETAALELSGQGIALNCISPGFVATDFHNSTLEAGPDLAGGEFYESTRKRMEEGSIPAEVGAHCAAFLVSDRSAGINGKFIAAPYDNYEQWVGRLDELVGTDLFTLRRIMPKDRGGDWQ